MRMLLLAGALLLASAGCGGDSVPAADLNGRTYTSTSVRGHELVEGTRVKLAFEDGRMSVNGGCNTMGADYEVDHGTLRWTGEVMSTLMGCAADLQAQDEWLNRLFTDGVDAEIDGDVLTLTTSEVSLELAAG